MRYSSCNKISPAHRNMDGKGMVMGGHQYGSHNQSPLRSARSWYTASANNAADPDALAVGKSSSAQTYAPAQGTTLIPNYFGCLFFPELKFPQHVYTIIVFYFPKLKFP